MRKILAVITVTFLCSIANAQVAPPKRESRWHHDFIRIQMPISGGLSGSPVIDDENRAVAVVNLAGVWHPALDALIGLSDKGQLGPPVLLLPNGQNSLNLNWAVGELANSFHRYASPGYGDSVPLRYLKKKAPLSNPTSSQSVH